MSFNLSISGHVDDEATAAVVDELLSAAGADLVLRLRDVGIEPVSASFSGPTGYVNYLLKTEDPGPDDDEPSPPDLE